MRAIVTTALDVLGILLVAAGLTALLLPVIGWVALAVGGLVVLAASQLASRLATPAAADQRRAGEFS